MQSFLSSGSSPCGLLNHAKETVTPENGMFVLCPDDTSALGHPSVLTPPPGVWAKLDSVQRILWFIDEVEARWQNLLARFPGVGQHNITWCQSTQFVAQIPDFARLLGGDDLTPQKCESHLHTQSNLKRAFNETYIAARDAEYARLMGLTELSGDWTAKGRSVLAVQQSVMCP